MADKIIDGVAESFLGLFPVMIKYFYVLGDRSEDPNYSTQTYEILHTLKELGDQSISAVGKRLDISKSRMTVLVDAMIAGGLIVRTGTDADRRVSNIGLTEKGGSLTAEHRRLLKAGVTQRFSGLSSGELERFLQAMEVIRSVMAKTDAGEFVL